MLLKQMAILTGLLLAMFSLNFFTFWQAKNVNGFWPLFKFFIASGLFVGLITYPSICILFRLAYVSFHKMWIPQLTVSLSSLAGAAVMVYWLFGEIPSKGTFWGGLIVLAGLILAVVWK